MPQPRHGTSDHRTARTITSLLRLCLLLGTAASIDAADADTRLSLARGNSLSSGAGGLSTLTASADWPSSLGATLGQRWGIAPRWEAAISLWNPEGDSGADHDTAAAGVRIVAQKTLSADGGAFLEAGTGPIYVSNRRVLQALDLGAHLLFENHVGIGTYLGRGGDYLLSYRLLHVSNGGTDRTNPGINFHTIQFGSVLR